MNANAITMDGMTPDAMTTEKEMEQRILDVVADVLGVSAELLEQSPNDHRMWDSLAHLNIVLGVEEACDVRFAPERIPELRNVYALLQEMESIHHES